MYDPIAPINKLKFLDPFAIETPVCDVYYNDVFIGFATEYTVRNIQLAVKNKEVENKYRFVYKDKSSAIDSNTFKITPQFESGFFNLSSNLAYNLINKND